MTKPPKQWTFDADNLTREVRRWVVGRWEPPPVVASALAYELTALIAHADSVDDATALIDQWAATAKDQVARLGVGGWHP